MKSLCNFISLFNTNIWFRIITVKKREKKIPNPIIKVWNLEFIFFKKFQQLYIIKIHINCIRGWMCLTAKYQTVSNFLIG
jgi:hypothetical protein